MDFFQAQDLARQRTGRLVGLFVLAVLGIIAAGYLAGIGILSVARRGDTGWWEPKLFLGVLSLTVAVVALSALTKWFELRQGGSVVARRLGGSPLSAQSRDAKHRELLNIVEEMSIASGVPVPEVYLLDEPSINAFAAGFSTADAVIGVTRGCLENLTRDELQAVIAHEFSHILNGDMRLNIRISAVVFGILALGLLGRLILEGMRHVRPSRSRNDKGGGAFAVILLSGLALFVIGYLGYFFGRLIQAAVSRQREFLADASAVQFTRNPEAVAGVLKKIGGLSQGSGLEAEHALEFSHFFFAQAFAGGLTDLFATHPPLVERIKAIDPAFDGRFPPVRLAGSLAPEKPARRPATAPQTSSFASGGPSGPSAPSPFSSVGQPAQVHLLRARDLLGSLPAEVVEAAHSPAAAPALVYRLLLDREPALRARQLALLENLDPEAHRATVSLAAFPLPPEARLPLLQIALRPLADNSPRRQDAILRAFDALIREDGRCSTFEFALQKLVRRHLILRLRPSAGPRQILSPSDVVPEISTILSALSWLGASDENGARRAFASGSRAFAGLHPAPAFLAITACGFKQLDEALDLLAGTTFQARQRILSAVVDTCSADGVIKTGEAEMLRAIASVLDCPVPPILSENDL